MVEKVGLGPRHPIQPFINVVPPNGGRGPFTAKRFDGAPVLQSHVHLPYCRNTAVGNAWAMQCSRFYRNFEIA